MFGRKRIAELEGKLADLQQGHDALVVRYTGVNQELRELRAWNASIENGQGAQAGLFDALVKSHAKTIKQVSDLQEKARLAGRKKVRRRNPRTGRFEWGFPDEVGEPV